MVQYGEIKALEEIIKAFECNWVTPEKIIPAIDFLKKYHTILEGWYGDEQYHTKVEEGLEL